ncbi:MAG: VWA domain-containing protein [Desulfurococcales archaeon]|nr:VWA domain-containing protein [Desulfurococcales archaeon]
MSSQSDITRRLVSIANRLRERGVKVGTMEIETALRLYKAAILLSGYNYYPLSRIIDAVFVKRDYEKAILDDVLRSTVGESVERGEEAPSKKKGKAEKKQEKSRAMGGSSLRSRRCLEMLKRYLETENQGYLDMIRDELRIDTRSEVKEYRVGGEIALEKLIARFALNPRDYSALARIALMEGETAILAMRHLSSKRKRRVAEQIASMLAKLSGGRRLRVKGGKWEKTYQRERIDIRRTLILKSRGKIGEVAYRRRRKTANIVLIIDRSDSMRKHADKIVEIASAYLNKASHLVLFSDEVKVTSISSWKSRLYLLDQILDLSFHGYTNITMALRQARRLAKPGSTLVLISDLQQTIKDHSPLKLIEDLGKGGYRIIIYTTKEASRVLGTTLRGDITTISFG